MQKSETDKSNQYYAKNRQAWRAWLQKNHAHAKNVWLVIYHKSSKKPSLGYNGAVEEAVCFGWIDSKPNKRDEESYFLYFTGRSPKSKWSNANRQRAEKMIERGFMAQAGMEMINVAKKIGTWTALENVQKSNVPPDLERAFKKNKTAKINFSAFPASSKRIILEWILNAKKTETRQKRISDTVRLAEINIKANHYRQ